MNENQSNVVERYFNAMRRKRDGTEELISLFDEDASYVEPFSGARQPATWTGKEQIGGFLRAAPEHAPPDMEVRVDRIDRDGGNVRAEWTCTSDAFARPMRGYDIFTIENGKIARLETTLTEGPDA